MQVTDLKPLTDSEYDLAERLARTLAVCPTCGSKEEAVSGAGIKLRQSPGYYLDGEHHDCDCDMQIVLYAHYLVAGIGTQYMRLDWNDFSGTKEADRWVQDYIENWRQFLLHGFGLTFASKTQGVGKTWAATHIGKELIKQRQKVYCIDFVKMVDSFCDPALRPEIEQRMREATFLILDDVREGISERQTDLYALKFEVVVRDRTNFNLPTIFTTNLTREEFEGEFPRIYSLIASKQHWVEMNGEDHRKKVDTAEETAAMIAAGEVRPIT